MPNKKLSESMPASEVNGSEKWRNLYSSLKAALSEKKYFSPIPTCDKSGSEDVDEILPATYTGPVPNKANGIKDVPVFRW